MPSDALITGLTAPIANPGFRAGIVEAPARARNNPDPKGGEAGLQPRPQAERKPEPEDLSAQIDLIETLRAELDADLSSVLQIDRQDRNGEFIYRFLNRETGETLRQWPPEKYLELVEFLRSKQGGLIDQTA